VKSFDWQRVWRGAGIQFLGLFAIASLVRGAQPKVGASTDAFVAFYDGDRTRILIATVIFGFALLNLMWFGAAIASALRDAGKAGWGNAATAASTAFAGVWFVIITIGATLAYSIAGSGNNLLTSGLNDLTWALLVLSSFPIAMVIMSGSFGLWRAGILSSRGFALGVTAMVLPAPAGHDVGGRRILGPRRCVLAVRRTDRRGALDPRHQPRPAPPEAGRRKGDRPGGGSGALTTPRTSCRRPPGRRQSTSDRFGDQWERSFMSWPAVQIRGDRRAARTCSASASKPRSGTPTPTETWTRVGHRCPPTAGSDRTRSDTRHGPDLHSSRSEAVLWWCLLVAPTGFEPALPP
jgi:hypothetical protein